MVRGAPDRIKSLREESITIRGCKLFNAMPKELRELKNVSVDQFKEKLDIFLRKIPDEPCLRGSPHPTGNNSILVQITRIR